MSAPTVTISNAPNTALAASRGRATGPVPAKVAKLGAFYLVMTAIALVFLVPYIFTLFAAFKPIDQISANPPGLHLTGFTCTTSPTTSAPPGSGAISPTRC